MTIQLYPGEWRTRDGRKVVIKGEVINGWWFGHLAGNYCHWHGDGSYWPDYAESVLDIIAPWAEPTKPNPLIFGNSIVGSEPVPKPPEDTMPVLRIRGLDLFDTDDGTHEYICIKTLQQACDKQGIKLEII